MDYWEKQDAMKRELNKLAPSGRSIAYVKTLEDSAVSWHREWEKERAKRLSIEAKYERLTRKIKENALKEVNEREVNDGTQYVNFDDDRMDVIGQNGNDGLHYEVISDEEKAQNLKEYLERLAAFDEYEKDGM